MHTFNSLSSFIHCLLSPVNFQSCISASHALLSLSPYATDELRLVDAKQLMGNAFQFSHQVSRFVVLFTSSMYLATGL